MNGFGAKMGYKQFFTHKKNIGLRYYGFLDYGYANFGDTNLKVGANLVTYGVGTDFYTMCMNAPEEGKELQSAFSLALKLQGKLGALM